MLKPRLQQTKIIFSQFILRRNALWFLVLLLKISNGQIVTVSYKILKYEYITKNLHKKTYYKTLKMYYFGIVTFIDEIQRALCLDKTFNKYSNAVQRHI